MCFSLYNNASESFDLRSEKHKCFRIQSKQSETVRLLRMIPEFALGLRAYSLSYQRDQQCPMIKVKVFADYLWSRWYNGDSAFYCVCGYSNCCVTCMKDPHHPCFGHICTIWTKSFWARSRNYFHRLFPKADLTKVCLYKRRLAKNEEGNKTKPV